MALGESEPRTFFALVLHKHLYSSQITVLDFWLKSAFESMYITVYNIVWKYILLEKGGKLLFSS